MNGLENLFKSSVGKKLIMAITGFALVLFVIGHMIGNLQIFLSPEAINRYAHFLQSNVELLWPVRIGLLALVGLHVWAAARLTAENRAARPVRYESGSPAYAASFASRTMIVSGAIVAAFVIYHLLHYTARVEAVNGLKLDFHSLKDPKTGYPDVYAMMVAGFSVWYVSLFYIFAVGLLCLHLSHGISAMFQSLGLKNQVYGPLLNRASAVVAAALFIGYVSIPIAVLCGYGKDHLKQVSSPSVALSSATAEVEN